MLVNCLAPLVVTKYYTYRHLYHREYRPGTDLRTCIVGSGGGGKI